MTITPKGKQVVVKPDPISDTYASGLIRSTKLKPNTGVVIALSPDYEFPFKEGARVQYSPNHQLELESGDVIIRGDEEGAIMFVFND